MKSISYFRSTIGSKQLMGLAGLGFALFLFTHMAANMLILFDPRAYNLYSHALISNPLIYFAEAILVVIFVYHSVKGTLLTVRNWKAREKGYAIPASGEKKTSLITKTMWAQGLVILAFLILHLATFKFGTLYETQYDGEAVRDLHRLVLEVFSHPGYVVWYLLSLVLIGFHLSHGMSSIFQTLGVRHPKYTPLIRVGGWIYTLVVVGGFISQPLYVFFIHKG